MYSKNTAGYEAHGSVHSAVWKDAAAPPMVAATPQPLRNEGARSSSGQRELAPKNKRKLIDKKYDENNE